MSDERFTPTPPPAPGPEDQTARYCLRCHARLPSHREGTVPQCPQCTLPYDPNNRASYDTEPMGSPGQQWLPGLVLAVLTGAAAYAFIWWTGELGTAIFVAVPFSVGGVIGSTAPPRIWLALGASLFAVCCIVGIVLFMGLHGIFCGMILGTVLIVPTLFGCCVGFVLRLAFQPMSWDQRRKYFIGSFLLLPYAGSAIEHFVPRPTTPVEVRTGMDFPASTRATWESIVFYEQVEHEPPWVLTLGLPRPLGTEGGDWIVGQRKRCRYDRGCYLVKEITARIDGRFMAFRVIEQHLPLEGCKRRCNDYTLTGGSFALEPLSEERTRVVLTTHYERRMRPGFIFEPIERRIIHALHAHVLEGMRRRLGRDGDESYPPQLDPPSAVLSEARANEAVVHKGCDDGRCTCPPSGSQPR